MSEQTDYLNKFLEAKFTHIDASVETISNAVNDLKGQFTDLRNEVREEIKGVKEELVEVKADNKSTRHWILGSAITFFFGFIAAAIAIFFGFAQLQTSWIQTVIFFVGKTIVK
jgi:hypothetical protein